MSTKIGLDASQFRLYVVRPALLLTDLWSREAEELLLGTAAAESQLRYVRQIGGGPALGLFQMEPATHRDCWENYLRYRPELAARIDRLALPGMGRLDQLCGNHLYAAAMARVKYLRDPHPLPEASDVPAMAKMWKRVYNSSAGAGTVEHFVAMYRALIQPAPTGL